MPMRIGREKFRSISRSTGKRLPSTAINLATSCPPPRPPPPLPYRHRRRALMMGLSDMSAIQKYDGLYCRGYVQAANVISELRLFLLPELAVYRGSYSVLHCCCCTDSIALYTAQDRHQFPAGQSALLGATRIP